MATRQLELNFDYFDALNRLGFTKELSQKRVELYENAAKCFAKVNKKNWGRNERIIIPGSRGEGMAVSLNSDIDVIFLEPAVMAFETYQTAGFKADEYVATFQLDFHDVPEGYAKLRLNSMQAEDSGIKRRINAALTEENYLRNDLRIINSIELGGSGVKREGWFSKHYDFDSKTGPSQPVNFPIPFIKKSLSVDHVAALSCSYPSLFDQWSKRERKGIWPSFADQSTVKDTEVFVVPVGRAGSNEEKLQWRISFTLAERYLVRSFNDVQIKVYTALKMLVKQDLKPICANITSYIVKNVSFWVFEKRLGTFTRMDFDETLMQALQYLKTCVEDESLDSYIIPSRNLLFGKISTEKSELINRLGRLIKEGPSALSRCPLIGMFHQPQVKLERRLLVLKLSDQVLISLLALPPSEYDRLEHLFHEEQIEAGILDVYLKNILPIVRETNPFGYFGDMISRTDADLLVIALEVIMTGYDEIWGE